MKNICGKYTKGKNTAERVSMRCFHLSNHRSMRGAVHTWLNDDKYSTAHKTLNRTQKYN
jgi:hypothetical protein